MYIDTYTHIDTYMNTHILIHTWIHTCIHVHRKRAFLIDMSDQKMCSTAAIDFCQNHQLTLIKLWVTMYWPQAHPRQTCQPCVYVLHTCTVFSSWLEWNKVKWFWEALYFCFFWFHLEVHKVTEIIEVILRVIELLSLELQSSCNEFLSLHHTSWLSSTAI